MKSLARRFAARLRRNVFRADSERIQAGTNPSQFTSPAWEQFDRWLATERLADQDMLRAQEFELEQARLVLTLIGQAGDRVFETIAVAQAQDRLANDEALRFTLELAALSGNALTSVAAHDLDSTLA